MEPRLRPPLITNDKTQTNPMKDTMKKPTLSVMAALVVLFIGTVKSFAGWISSPTFPTLSEYESIAGITFSGQLYVAVNFLQSDGPSYGYLYRLDGSTWNVVPNSIVYGLADQRTIRAIKSPSGS